ARALLVPLVAGLAWPVMILRKRGMATTREEGVPRSWSSTERGRSTCPAVPSGSPAFASDLRSLITGQKYVDWSPSRQVVSAAARLSSVENASVERLPT